MTATFWNFIANIVHKLWNLEVPFLHFISFSGITASNPQWERLAHLACLGSWSEHNWFVLYWSCCFSSQTGERHWSSQSPFIFGSSNTWDQTRPNSKEIPLSADDLQICSSQNGPPLEATVKSSIRRPGIAWPPHCHLACFGTSKGCSVLGAKTKADAESLKL